MTLISHPLRHLLAAELEDKGLGRWQGGLEKACDQQFQEKPFRPGNFLHLCGAQSLDLAGKRVLKALYLFREKEARRRDRAPFRILTNETLVRLALQRPKTIRDFSRIKGVPRTYSNSKAAHPLIELIQKRGPR
jgi:ribonuclease D